MSVEVDRIPALQLTLADMVFDDHAGLQRWVPVVGLDVDSDHVLVYCEGDEQPLRIPAGALVAARRRTIVAQHIDDADLLDEICGCYPGDVDSACAAVAAHAHVPTPTASLSCPYPRSHYEGFYGGDLDHVVDAVGGTPDIETRGRRAKATRRHQHVAHPDVEAVPDRSLLDEEGELLGRIGDGFVGDVRYILTRRR